MKKTVTKELWVHNPGTADVSISDLGVKVAAGKAVNIYRHNPYLTEYQVQESLENGVLFKKLTAGQLKLVAKKVNPEPPTLNHVKESDGTVQAKKTKTSVVIESNVDEAEQEGSFDFADYGISDLGPVTQDMQDDGAIVVNAKQDEAKEPEKGVELKPTLESGISEQSQIVMKNAQEAMTDPTGPIADASPATQDRPFTVVKPPQPEPEPKEATSPTGQPVNKDETGAVVVGKKEARNIVKVKRAQEEGTDDYTLPGDDEEGADKVIDFQETEFDSKAATKTEDGSIVMKIKEEEPKEPKKTVVTKKPRPSKEK